MRPRRESGGIETISRESRKKSAEVSEKWEKEREGGRKMQLRERRAEILAVSEKVGPLN